MGVNVLKGLFIKEGVTHIEPKEPHITRELTDKYACKLRGSIRLSSGKYYTKEEWAERRRELTKKTLP